MTVELEKDCDLFGRVARIKPLLSNKNMAAVYKVTLYQT